MKLGEKRKEMYPTAQPDNMPEEVMHKTVNLPLKLLADLKVKKGDKIKICIEGEITGIHDDEYSSDFQMKAEEGEVMEGGKEKEEGEEGGTYLGKSGK